jgi:type IV pilus assembly protein PilM
VAGFTKPKKAIGIDVGTHSIKSVLMSRQGRRLRVDEVGYALVDRNEYNVDPIIAQANAVTDSLQSMPVAQCLTVGALPGQTVVIRYPRFNDMPNAELSDAVQREAGQNIPYDLSEVFLDWNLLDTYAEGDQTMLKVLLVAAKHEVIDSRVQIADAAALQYGVLSVDSLALADAAESCGMLGGEETVALINLGASSTSIHFTKDGVSNFIRDVNWGAREMITALSKSRRCDYGEAEEMLAESIHEQQEPAAPAPMEPAVAEPEPAPDPEPMGGGSLLDPLDDELGGLGDIGDIGAAAPAAAAPAPALGGDEASGGSLRQQLETPLGRLVTEIRRSFDFYEQQLYERPVDRIILSGGVAHLPLVRDTMAEELGIEDVTAADPSAGDMTLGKDSSIGQLTRHPAQFMIAVGLAARGMAEL